MGEIKLPEVIEAGTALAGLHRAMIDIRLQIADVESKVAVATNAVCDKTNATRMQAAEAMCLLNELKAATYKSQMAHDSLRQVLTEHGVAQPTAQEIKASWR